MSGRISMMKHSIAIAEESAGIIASDMAEQTNLELPHYRLSGPLDPKITSVSAHVGLASSLLAQQATQYKSHDEAVSTEAMANLIIAIADAYGIAYNGENHFFFMKSLFGDLHRIRKVSMAEAWTDNTAISYDCFGQFWPEGWPAGSETR